MNTFSSKDFFISYNKADRGWAEWVAWQLEREGYTTILQVWDFRPGANPGLLMQEATRKAKQILTILSPEYLVSQASAFVQDPTRKDSTLVLIRVKECALEGILTSVGYIDIVGLSEARARDAILQGILNTRVKSSQALPFPGTPPSMAAQQPDFPGNFKPVEIFMSYAHADRLWIDRFEKHLRSLRSQGIIDIWHDRDISAGQEWASEVDAHLEQAQIVLLFVSPDFMASDYVYSSEFQRVMERNAQAKTRVIPIILRSVYWQQSPFSMLAALPRSGRPISSWANTDIAIAEVIEQIRRVIQHMNNSSSYTETILPTTTPPSSIGVIPPYATPDQSNREIQLDRAKVKIQQWEEHLVRENEWNWHILGTALQIAYKTTEEAPNYQQAWTTLADIYHRIGKRELAEQCLKKSEALINSVSDTSVRAHKEVQINIDTGYPFNKEGGLQRQLPPLWFEEKYQSYWTLS